MNSENLPSTAVDIARLIDVSAVQAGSTDEQARQMVDFARRYGCHLVSGLPSQTAYLKSLLGGDRTPKLGGNVGFPSGGQTTQVKVVETRQLVEMGVDEVDMVIDIAALLSDRLQQVQEDIAAVVEAAEGRPVKAILECHYLADDQIRSACDLAIAARAAFVKTSTGWARSGATLENVALIKAHVADAIQIKASGGIRSLETLLAMHRLGANRFGISTEAAARILQSAKNQA